MRLTDHFSLEALCVTQHKELDNTPPADIAEKLLVVAEGLERIRSFLGDHPITVNSGYRSPAVNKAVGGQSSSQHMKGEAADIVCPDFGSPREIAEALKDHLEELGIDQCILEFDRWVHVSFKPEGEPARHAMLTIDKQGTHTGIV